MINFLLIAIFIFAPVARGSVRVWALAPIEIITLTAFCLAIVRLCSGKDILLKKTKLDIPLLFFASVFCFSIFNTPYIHASIYEFLRLLNLAVIFFLIVNFINDRGKIKTTLNAILISGTCIALYGILQYIGAFPRQWWDTADFLSATYVNHNHFAGLMELMIPLSIGMTLSERDTGKKWFYAYSLIILSVAFILSMSRGGWFSLGISMVFMCFVILKGGRSRFVFSLGVLVLAVSGVFMIQSSSISALSERFTSYRELDFAGRLEIWKGVLALIKENWLLGTGPGSFIYVFPKYRPAGLNMLVNYAHNDYLQVASEIGVFGFAAMFVVIGKTIIKGLRTHFLASSSFKKWISLSLVTGILSLSIHGIGDFNFYIPSNAILFTVFCALMFSIYSRREKEPGYFVLKPEAKIYKFFRPMSLIIAFSAILFTAALLTAESFSSLSDTMLSGVDLEKAEKYSVLSENIMPLKHDYPYKTGEIYTKKYFAQDKDIKWAKRAEGRYLDSLRLNSMDGWTWIALADIRYELFKRSLSDYRYAELANFAYKKALELDPLNSYYLKKFATFLLNRGETDLSSSMYDKASFVMDESESLSVLPKKFTDSYSYIEKADIDFAADNIDKALIFYKMSEKFGGGEDSVLGQMRCYFRMSMLREGLSEYMKTDRDSLSRAVMFASLGDYYLRKGYDSLAEKFSEKALASDPSGAEGYYLRHKISRAFSRNRYSKDEITSISRFNDVPVSTHFKKDGFTLEIELKKNLNRESAEDMRLILPEGIYEVRLRAKGRIANGIWPHLSVEFNGKDAMNTYVTSSDWEEYRGVAIVSHPYNIITISYDNDYYNPSTGEDRNLYLDGIIFESLY